MNNLMKIEWSSDFHSDGRRRSRPKASTIHGWLAKWRGTFSGNERLRSEGMREMREAKRIREKKRMNQNSPPPGPKRSKSLPTNATRQGSTSRRPSTKPPAAPVRRATAPTGGSRRPQAPVRRTTAPAHGSRPHRSNTQVQSRPSQRRPSTAPTRSKTKTK